MSATPLDDINQIEAKLKELKPNPTLDLVQNEVAKIKKRIVRDSKVAMRSSSATSSPKVSSSPKASASSTASNNDMKGSPDSNDDKWISPSPPTVPPSAFISGLVSEALRLLSSAQYSRLHPPEGSLCKTPQECLLCLSHCVLVALGWSPLQGGGTDASGFERAVRAVDANRAIASSDRAGWNVAGRRVSGYITVTGDGSLAFHVQASPSPSDSTHTVDLSSHFNSLGFEAALAKSPAGVIPSLLFVDSADLVAKIAALAETAVPSSGAGDAGARPKRLDDLPEPFQSTDWVRLSKQNSTLPVGGPTGQKKYFDADKDPMMIGGIPGRRGPDSGGMLVGPDAPIFQGGVGGRGDGLADPRFAPPLDPRFAPPSGFGFDGSLEPGMVPRFDPMHPPGVGPRGGQSRREDRIRGNHDAGKPPKLPDNNMFM